MIRQTLTAAMLVFGTAFVAVAAGQPPALTRAHEDSLKAAIAAPTRTPANDARDRYRHPYETLAFFGVRPNRHVVEIWPGGGWYTEILAPYVQQRRRHYYAASDGRRTAITACGRMMTANPALYGDIRLAAFPAFDADRHPRARRQRRRRPHLPQRPQLADGLSAQQPALWRGGVPPDVRDAEARRHARRGRPPPAGKRRRRARADQRLHQGLDRPPARRGGRLPLRRRVRGQRQSARHRRLAERRLDAAAARCASATRTASAISPSARATG